MSTQKDQDYLQRTGILDFDAPAIAHLIDTRGWRQLPPEQAARAVYEFCRDEILFGYNAGADSLPASAILKEGLGHCNTKSNLLMALLRALGIPCRLRAFTIDKRLQKGAMTAFVYFMAPREILHTWVEVELHGQWVVLEGVILDEQYLRAVQNRFSNCQHAFLGYAVATPSLAEPAVQWTGRDTYIQREGIARELGLYASPDDFYREHKTNLNGVKGWLYHNFFYKVLNDNVRRIREGALEGAGSQACAHQDSTARIK
ncbi:transglutaminase-like domain-containing protein [Pseudomonas sp. 5P_5.1_Bac1]|uniref:transglutaminase-like domain-containing protein n=1 Tax=Pseudomonas sp. 5P_5.1_Bac1 TaxID=2971616 RepID=UPI0021C6BADA|nr:transglutaminase-like domain-containing protein [Pseudomonas sp. 5P_5.1_Bac1]MCU1721756.1 transglutaminase-like domain-containing protein [Pseudomonas sp. 5P_5.1_Bac1]